MYLVSVINGCIMMCHVTLCGLFNIPLLLSVTASLFLAEDSLPTGDLAAAAGDLVKVGDLVETGDLVTGGSEALEEECLILGLGCGLLAAASLSNSNNSLATPSSFLLMTNVINSLLGIPTKGLTLRDIVFR